MGTPINSGSDVPANDQTSVATPAAAAECTLIFHHSVMPKISVVCNHSPPAMTIISVGAPLLIG